MTDTHQGNMPVPFSSSRGDAATTNFFGPTLRPQSAPAPPFSLEEARRLSRARFFWTRGPRLAFSSKVKDALAPPGTDRSGSTEDHHLEGFLRVGSSQRRWITRGEPQFDALHFCLPSTSENPKGYDEIHLRTVFNHDIAFAVEKQNKIEAVIRASGFIIDDSVVDAHLLIIFEHLLKLAPNRLSTTERSSPDTYEVYHNLGDEGAVRTQYWHQPSQTRIRLDEAIPEQALPDCEALHDVFQQPQHVLRVENAAVIKAWEMLTKDMCMQWIAHKGDDGTPYSILAFAYDKVADSGELRFEAELIYLKHPENSLPVSCADCRREIDLEGCVGEVIEHKWEEEGVIRRSWFTVNGVVIGVKEPQSSENSGGGISGGGIESGIEGGGIDDGGIDSGGSLDGM